MKLIQVLCTVVSLIGLTSFALGQCLQGQTDTIYQIRVEQLSAGPLDPGTVIQSYPLVQDSWNNEDAWFEADVQGERRRQVSSSGSTSGRTLQGQLAHETMVRAASWRGNIYGGGTQVVVRVYVKHSVPGPGQGYYASWEAIGSVQAIHPSGLGTTQAEAPGQYVVGDADGEQVPVNTRSGYSGVTTSETLSGYPDYFFATELRFRSLGWTQQVFLPCFPPFCPGGVFEYLTRGDTRFFVDAGPGPIPCTGSLRVPIVDYSCSFNGSAIPPVVATNFRIEADFSGNCACCEYRQYVTSRAEACRDFLGLGFRCLPRPPITNCDGSSSSLTCLVEDSSDSQGPNCVRYGHREDADVPRSECDVDGGGPRDAYPSLCEYRGCDTPDFNLANTHEYRWRLDFVGLIVVKSGPGCSPQEIEVARREWSVCCEGDAVEGVHSLCEGGGPSIAPLWIPVRVGEYSGWLGYSAQPNNQIAITVGFKVAQSDSWNYGDIELNASVMPVEAPPPNISIVPERRKDG